MLGIGSRLLLVLLVATACGGRTALTLLPSDANLANDANVGVNANGAANSGGGDTNDGAGATTNDEAGGSGAATLTHGRGGPGAASGEPVVSHRLATSVSAGTDMTCATERGGAVWCWGLNDRGQLGDGTLNDSTVPVRVSEIDDALTVNAGGTWTSGGKGAGLSAFACARLRDDTLECWGSNYGWLGDVARMPSSSLPLPIDGASGVTAVGAGNFHLCALLGASVSCWGDDRWGQLGDGNQTTCAGSGCRAGTANPLGAVSVVGITDAIAVAAHGSDFTCAVLADTTVQCWGALSGAVSPGWSVSPTPVTIAGVTGSTSGLAVGFNHACAFPASGDVVQCWGDNSQGQLGDGTTSANSTAVAVQGLDGLVIGVAAGLDHTCAVLMDGRVQCWGDNQWGELGDGSLMNSAMPVTVSGISDAVQVSAGYAHTCAFTRAGRVLCWGQNGLGQVGNGETSARVAKPVYVTGF